MKDTYEGDMMKYGELQYSESTTSVDNNGSDTNYGLNTAS
jgi:hypothetical protein